MNKKWPHTAKHPHTRHRKELQFSNNLHVVFERRIIENLLQSPTLHTTRPERRREFAYFLMNRSLWREVIEITGMTGSQFETFVGEHRDWQERSPWVRSFVLEEERQCLQRLIEAHPTEPLLRCRFPDTLHHGLTILRTRATIRMWPLEGETREGIKRMAADTQFEEVANRLMEMSLKEFTAFMSEHERWNRLHIEIVLRIEEDEQALLSDYVRKLRHDIEEIATDAIMEVVETLPAATKLPRDIRSFEFPVTQVKGEDDTEVFKAVGPYSPYSNSVQRPSV